MCIPHMLPVRLHGASGLPRANEPPTVDSLRPEPNAASISARSTVAVPANQRGRRDRRRHCPVTRVPRETARRHSEDIHEVHPARAEPPSGAPPSSARTPRLRQEQFSAQTSPLSPSRNPPCAGPVAPARGRSGRVRCTPPRTEAPGNTRDSPRHRPASSTPEVFHVEHVCLERQGVGGPSHSPRAVARSRRPPGEARSSRSAWQLSTECQPGEPHRDLIPLRRHVARDYPRTAGASGAAPRAAPGRDRPSWPARS